MHMLSIKATIINLSLLCQLGSQKTIDIRRQKKHLFFLERGVVIAIVFLDFNFILLFLVCWQGSASPGHALG